MKQTAVNYLINEISDILGVMETNTMQNLLLVDAVKKAKLMEQEQIDSAYLKGVKSKELADLKQEQVKLIEKATKITQIPPSKKMEVNLKRSFRIIQLALEIKEIHKQIKEIKNESLPIREDNRD
jgi:hypothetical protein